MIIKKTIPHALNLIGLGVAELFGCLIAYVIVQTKDVARCAVRHWLTSVVILALLVVAFVSMTKARAERDEANRAQYTLEKQCDSLKIAIEPFIKK